ncbi:ribonuclease H-like YkuK family protein [Thermosyntropha sp.]|uniref:ribonuclease H-like YkuK family protein n=1 Tax=Thermosyntropha sp. TaxID=2740820 RepID=UPI0025EC4019|nr:ribonuclease H-like YkuK family protein [Thermosyntropha sp.]MBO8159972.1 ribonuclease H-like YkuK family protein [Thermosyntropha sp.]
MIFKSPTRGEISLEEVVEDIIKYINEDNTRHYKIIVGSDSQPKERETCFVSAIIVHRIGKGARYYYHKEVEPKVRNMRQRIFYEASLSLALADKLSSLLKEKGRENMPVEIHLDVGTKGETKELVKEIIGMIIGSGFEAKIKPDASAASKVADKYTK